MRHLILASTLALLAPLPALAQQPPPNYPVTVQSRDVLALLQLAGTHPIQFGQAQDAADLWARVKAALAAADPAHRHAAPAKPH